MLAKWQPRSIRGIAFAIGLGAALVTALLGLATYAVVHQEIERQIDHRIEVETESLLAQYKAYGFEGLVKAVQTRETSAAGDIGYMSAIDLGDRSMGYILTDAQGRRRAGHLKAPMPKPGWSEFLHFERPDGSKGIAQVMNSPVPGGGRLIVAADRAIVDAMDYKLFKLFLVEFGVIMAIIAFASYNFGRLIHHRLAGIRRTAEEIMDGNLSHRMPVESGRGELDRLASSLNAMLDRIAALVENLRHTNVGIAHDIRTPVARMRQRLEVAQNSADPKMSKLLGEAISESDDVLELLTSLLAISELNSKTVRKRFKALKLDEVLSEMAASYQPSLEEKGIALSTSLEPVQVMGDKRLLQQMLANLFDNLALHTPAGTQAMLKIWKKKDRAMIRLSDTGPGILEQDAQKVFEPMVRLDRSRSTSGYGIGLSMVSAIASVHDGTAQIIPSEAGLIIEIQISAI